MVFKPTKEKRGKSPLCKMVFPIRQSHFSRLRIQKNRLKSINRFLTVIVKVLLKLFSKQKLSIFS